jgi:hypothetical protein
VRLILLLQAGLLASALPLSTTLVLHAEDPWAMQEETLIETRRLDLAEKMLVARLVLSPRDPSLITLLAEIRFDQRRYQEAPRAVDECRWSGGAIIGAEGPTRAAIGAPLVEESPTFIAVNRLALRSAGTRRIPQEITCSYNTIVDDCQV